MDRDFLIQLTCELYRITLLFPKKDPLRVKMRDLGTDILAQMVILWQAKDRLLLSERNPGIFLTLENNLAVLDSYFELALAQNWVSPKDILEIKKQYYKVREYYKIREGLEIFERPEPKSQVSTEKAPVPETFLKKRQAKILEILKKKERAQVQDFKKDFPDISKRTLRRDLSGLSEQGLIKRIGKRSGTFYEIKARL